MLRRVGAYVSALAFQSYALVELAKAPESAKRRRKCLLADAARLRSFRAKHCGDGYHRRLKEVLRVIRDHTGARGAKPLTKYELRDLLAEQTKKPPSIEGVRLACRDLGRAGVVACDYNAVRWLRPSERGAHSETVKNYRAKVPYIGSDSLESAKSTPITYGSSAAPARRVIEPVDSAALDAIDDELAFCSEKLKSNVIQPLEPSRRDKNPSAEIACLKPAEREAEPKKAESHQVEKEPEAASAGLFGDIVRRCKEAQEHGIEKPGCLLAEVQKRQVWLDLRFLRAARLTTRHVAEAVGRLDMEGHRISGSLERRVTAYAKQIRATEIERGDDPDADDYTNEGEAARDLAPAFWRARGTGGRQWLI